MVMSTHPSAPLRVYVDASLAGDRSLGTVGAVFTTHMGRVVGEYSARIDAERSSAYAEFEAIVRALSFLEHVDGPDHIKVFGDCESVIGIFDPDSHYEAKKEEMISYETRVRQHLKNFKYYTFESIPRELNPADDVADNAYRRVVGHTVWFDQSYDRACRYVDHRTEDWDSGEPEEMSNYKYALDGLTD